VDSNDHKLYINRAVSYKKMGQFDLSLADLNKAIEKSSEDKDPFLERGIMYTDHFNKYDLGIADFKVFLKEHPNHRDATYNLGVAYYKKQSYDTALIFLNKAISLDSGYASAHYVAALSYAEIHDFRQAYNHGMQATSLGYDVSPGLLEYWKTNATK
jgi:tetratricopeptide (TPR) repeat protein